MKTDTGAIGVLGGVGPYAGLDLMRKIFDQTEANCDQEHLSVIQYSLSEHIIDRTRFLLGETDENPGEAIGEIMVRMAKAGATVIGVPCNTAHSPRIMDVAVAMLHEASPKTHFVHMIDSVVAFIRESLPHARKIGVTRPGSIRMPFPPRDSFLCSRMRKAASVSSRPSAILRTASRPSRIR